MGNHNEVKDIFEVLQKPCKDFDFGDLKKRIDALSPEQKEELDSIVQKARDQFEKMTEARNNERGGSVGKQLQNNFNNFGKY